MSGPCRTPIAFETLVGYWAGDLGSDESDRLEEHLIGCGVCSAESARVAAVASAIRSMTPPFLTDDEVAELRSRGLRVTDNPMSPGERKVAVFSRDTDYLIHRLTGLDLAGVDEVRVTVRVEETGAVLMEAQAPFNREKGEVLVACQRHFAAFPPNIVAEVRTGAAREAAPIAVYWIPHVFEGPAGA